MAMIRRIRYRYHQRTALYEHAMAFTQQSSSADGVEMLKAMAKHNGIKMVIGKRKRLTNVVLNVIRLCI